MIRRDAFPGLTSHVYVVGTMVYAGGRSATIVAVTHDGRYVVEYADGTHGTMWAHDMAPRNI